jgi:HNH endonuclease
VVGRIEMLVKRLQNRFGARYAGNCILRLGIRMRVIPRILSLAGNRPTGRNTRLMIEAQFGKRPDAAHIIMDADEQLGQPIFSNGLPLTKPHHAAFDAHLIGINPDFRVHVSDRLLDIHDGPFLELGPKGIVGQAV